MKEKNIFKIEIEVHRKTRGSRSNKQTHETKCILNDMN
jgi:hypothetical protein